MGDRRRPATWCCCRAGRSRRSATRPAPAARCSARVRSPRRSARRCARSRRTCGSPPLRDGLREALRLTGANSPRRLRTSPVVVTVGGRVAADLDLLGLSGAVGRSCTARPPSAGPAAQGRVAGRPAARRPAGLADDLVADRRRRPRGRSPTSTSRRRPSCCACCGARTDAGRPARPRGAGRAAARRPPRPADCGVGGPPPARRARAGRAISVRDAELVAAHPVLLSLVAPGIGVATPSPAARLAAGRPFPGRGRGGGAGVAAPARPLGPRAHRPSGDGARPPAGRRGVLTAPTRGHRPAARGAGRRSRPATRCRRSSSATPWPCPRCRRPSASPTTASSSRCGRRRRAVAAARVAAEAPARCTSARTTPPRPATCSSCARSTRPSPAMLPGLGGLVAETGSVLSHLAILAREYGVPTVVGLRRRHRALRRRARGSSSTAPRARCRAWRQARRVRHDTARGSGWPRSSS